jgi:2,4-dienoyl-CoA reductase-like NADH-dependent reductase (Old Yellow Enzyme family)
MGTYYQQRASAGLIVSEATLVSPQARGYLFTPGLFTDEQTDGWRRVVDAVHARQSIIFAQLWHCGRVSHESVLPPGQLPLSSTQFHMASLSTFAWTAEGAPGKVAVSAPRAMNTADFAAVTGQFGDAALRARAAGFDGIELLAGNGYLFEQFLNSAVNTRPDEYGGRTPHSRSRLLLEVIDEIIDRAGGLRIGVRISPFGLFNGMKPDPRTEQTYMYLAAELDRRGITYVHFNDEPVSIGHLNQDVQHSVDPTEPDAEKRRLIPASFFTDFRASYRGAVIICGGLTKDTAATFLADGSADLAAFGIDFIANPDLPRRLESGLPLAAPATELFYGGDARGYTDYPSHP